MKARTLIFEFGWFGFSRLTTGLFPGFAAGSVRTSWARGTLAEAIKAAVLA
jgi:hypothetical protein